MNRKDLLSLCARNLARRRTRTLLAVIGVVVGTCAIVVMLSIGFGLSASFQQQIESYGNLHLINVFAPGGGGGGGMMVSSSGNGGAGGQKQGVLDEKTIKAIEKIDGVEAVSPKESEYLTIAVGKFVAQTEVVGIRPEVMEKFGYELQEGRLLQPGDKYAIVFGNQVPSWFYNPSKSAGFSWGGEAQVDIMTDKMILTGDYAYGQKKKPGLGGEEDTIVYPEYKAKGVGILANANDESAYTAFMSLDALEKVKDDLKKARKESTFNQKKGYNSAMIYVGDIDKVNEISDAVRKMGFQTNSLSDWLKSMQDTARMIQGILGGIGAISLLVAALGITNTMIMSIYERTKEIGVMKVIGANLQDIRKMFLLEAGMIGFLGGLLGLAISYAISFLMNTVLLSVMSKMLGAVGGMGGGTSVVSIIPWWVSLGSLGFATAIGIISGYYPARRAMNLSALESLKNE